jgi:hypothetical protein
VVLLFDRVGIVHGPAHPLDQLTGEVVGLQVGGGYSLSIHDPVRGLLGDVGDYEYLRHCSLLVGDADSIALKPEAEVKIG